MDSPNTTSTLDDTVRSAQPLFSPLCTGCRLLAPAALAQSLYRECVPFINWSNSLRRAR
jgi:hypothetical protein